MKRIFKIILIILIISVCAVLLLIIISEIRITSGSKAYLFNEVEQLPDSQVVLVLGTAKKLANGQPNLFYSYRIQAAKELYDAGKVKAFVVSGDNRKHNYNEPAAMRKSLVEKGVPNSIIYSDYAGFRTLDSVIRIKKIFGQDTFTIVSQKFHNERAVYIARKNGLEAYGFNARDVPIKSSYKTAIRERFARVKVFIDMLINKEPKFLGEPVEIDV